MAWVLQVYAIVLGDLMCQIWKKWNPYWPESSLSARGINPLTNKTFTTQIEVNVCIQTALFVSITHVRMNTQHTHSFSNKNRLIYILFFAFTLDLIYSFPLNNKYGDTYHIFKVLTYTVFILPIFIARHLNYFHFSFAFINTAGNIYVLSTLHTYLINS